jgi:hypothetical protein
MTERIHVMQVTCRVIEGRSEGVVLSAVATVTTKERDTPMAFILWIIAVVIAIYGILRLVRGDILIGIVLLVVAALVGPGGYSIFQN